MELRQLRHFTILARTLNFRRASDELSIAQPALSISIRKLEEEIGSRLFDRDTREVSLTEVGRVTLESARVAIESAQDIVRASRAIRDGEQGRLTVGFVGGATHRLFPRILPAFKASYPDVELRLLESTSRRIIDDIADKRIDIGIVRSPLTFECDCDIREVESDELVAVLPGDHRLIGHERLSLGELRDDPFVMYSGDQVPSLRALVFAACWKLGAFVPTISQEAVQPATVVSLVRSHLGVALVPSAFTDWIGNDLAVCRIAGPSELLSVGLASVSANGDERPLVRKFIDALHSRGDQA